MTDHHEAHRRLIADLVAAAPPLTSEQVARLAALLRPAVPPHGAVQKPTTPTAS